MRRYVVTRSHCLFSGDVCREASGHPRKKRKRGSSFKAEEEEAEVGESPDRNFGESEHIMTMSSLLAQHNPAPGTLAPPASGPSFLSTTSSSSSSSSSSSLPPMATNVRGKRERESVGNSHAMTSAAPRNFFPHPDNFEDSQQVGARSLQRHEVITTHKLVNSLYRVRRRPTTSCCSLRPRLRRWACPGERCREAWRR